MSGRPPNGLRTTKERIIHMFLNTIMSFTHGKAYNDLSPVIKSHSKYLFIWSVGYFTLLFAISSIFSTQILPALVLFLIGLGLIGFLIYYSNKHVNQLFLSVLSGKYKDYSNKYKDVEDRIVLFVIGVSFTIMTAFFLTLIYFIRPVILNLVINISVINTLTNILLILIDSIPIFMQIPLLLIMLLWFIPTLYVWRLRINYGTKNKGKMSMHTRVFVGLSLLMFTLTRLIFLIFVFVINLAKGTEGIWCRAIIVHPKYMPDIEAKLKRLYGVKLDNIYSLPECFETVFGSRHNRIGFIIQRHNNFIIMSGLGELYIYGENEDSTDKLRDKLTK